MLKKFWMVLILVIVLQQTAAQGGETAVYKENRTVLVNGGQKTVTVVWADLKDKRVRVDAVLAGGKVGKVDDLNDIVKSATDMDGVALAGINGTFFQAYTDMQPLGTIVQDGDVRHIGNTGSVIAISEDGAQVDPLYVDIKGGTKDQWVWPYNWYAWNINHFYTDSTAVMIFDKYYSGAKPSHDFTAIAVDKDVVISVVKGAFMIPAEGFLLLTKDAEMIKKFAVGQSASFINDYYENYYGVNNHSEATLDYDDIRTVVGAGPTLVNNGVVVLNGAKEGFKEEKILSQAAQRSMIGVTAAGKLGMVSVSGVTMAQLAQIALQLGMVEAMNLDGGASSGLYYNGSYISAPGRQVSNALVVRWLYNDPIKVELNGKSLFFDTEPYINKQYGTTLVPLRTIAEALGAKVGWDNTTASVTIERYGKTIKLQSGSKILYTDGIRSEMTVPVTQRDSRLYVPVRAITELFGGAVSWDAAASTVRLEISDIESILQEALNQEKAGSYEAAVESYKRVLEVDEQNAKSAKAIAAIYNTNLSNKEAAIPYYEMAVAIDGTDYASLNSLGWAYYSVGRVQEAIESFTAYNQKQPNSAAGYYGLGICYTSPAVADVAQVKYYFNLSISKGLSGSPLAYAQNYLTSH